MKNSDSNAAKIKTLGIRTLIICTLALGGIASLRWLKDPLSPVSNSQTKLYWFVPDGFRAEPDVFNIYKWAEEGDLPNIRWMMDNGSYGYSIPDFPGHTPTNTASLMTGTQPNVHGIVDGGIRSPGYPLNVFAKNGFTSQAKKVDPVWFTLEDRGFSVAVLSLPGSTPPELNRGLTLRGRWGNWGIEFPAILFHSSLDLYMKEQFGLDRHQFSFGSELTRFIAPSVPKDWSIELPKSYSPAFEVNLGNWDADLFGWVADTTDDNQQNYDTIVISFRKTEPLGRIQIGEWSPWWPTILYGRTKNRPHFGAPKSQDWDDKMSRIAINTKFRIKPIALNQDDFRIRIIYDQINEFLVKPSDFFEQAKSILSPFVDFVDSYPPQLIFKKEDKETFLQEASMSFDSHKKLAALISKDSKFDSIIHGIYTPNQYLTSRWWLPFVDPKSTAYHQASGQERQSSLTQIKHMYQEIDAILGIAIKNRSKNQTIVLSSDHGAIPLEKEIWLNNLFYKKGWLEFKTDKNGDKIIDWKKTKVIFLQMNHIYINPENLSGPFKRSRGNEYEALRKQVIDVLVNLKWQNDLVFRNVVLNEYADSLHLDPESIGDLILVNNPGYNPVESIDGGVEFFKSTFKGGYKQGVTPDTQGLWTPFMIVGPGIKAKHALAKPIHHQDQYPTILKTMQQKIPEFVTGKPVTEIFETSD